MSDYNIEGQVQARSDAARRAAYFLQRAEMLYHNPHAGDGNAQTLAFIGQGYALLAASGTLPDVYVPGDVPE